MEHVVFDNLKPEGYEEPLHPDPQNGDALKPRIPIMCKLGAIRD